MSLGPLIPILTAVLVPTGVLLLIRGIRGEADLSFPSCANCGYDLRGLDLTALAACPECGKSTQARRAVNFGQYRSRPVTAIVGALLALAPVIIGGMSYLSAQRASQFARANQAAFMASVQPSYSSQTISQLLQSLPKSIDDPLIWDELMSRYNKRELIDDDISQVIDHLIATVKNRGSQNSPPYAYAREFLREAIRGDHLPEQQLNLLVETYYHRTLDVRMRRHIRSGADVEFFIPSGRHFDLPGLTTITSLQKVTLDNLREIEVQNPVAPSKPVTTSGTAALRGQLRVEAAPGKYKLQFHVDTWVVRAPLNLEGWENGNAPLALHQWSQRISTEVDIAPPDQPPVRLLGGDPEMALKIRRGIRVRELRVSPEGNDLQGDLFLTFNQKPPAPLSFNVYVLYDEYQVLMGCFTAGGAGNSRPTFIRRLPRFHNAIEHVKVVLRPNLDAVERLFNTNEMWNEEIVYENIPVVHE